MAEKNVLRWEDRETSRWRVQDFPSGPVAKTPCSQCKGHKFDPSSGNEDLICHVVWLRKNKKRKRLKPTVSAWRGFYQKAVTHKPGWVLPPDTKAPSTPILGFPASRNVQNKSWLFQPPGLWYFCYSSPNWQRWILFSGTYKLWKWVLAPYLSSHFKLNLRYLTFESCPILLFWLSPGFKGEALCSS